VLNDMPGLIAICERHNLASVNRSPLAMGLLTGKYTAGSAIGRDDIRGSGAPWLTWFAKGGRPAPAYLAQIDAIREILTGGGRTLAQGALAWIWARSPATIPIPGCRTVAQVDENAGALAHGPLTDADVAEIDRLVASA
jgi:aryl-alcohol dehydrogenase-like predicted oxidoreductase